MRYTSSLIALTLVAACGGGGGESAADDYTDLRSTFLRINNDIDFDTPVDPSTLPTSGTVNYDGALFIETPRDVDILGELEVEFDFGSAGFDGRATDFVDSDGDRYDGRLNIVNGNINRGADPDVTVTFFGDIDGTITDPDDNSYAVDAVIVGNFYENGDYIAGGIRGTVDSNLGDFTADDDNTGIRAER